MSKKSTLTRGYNEATKSFTKKLEKSKSIQSGKTKCSFNHNKILLANIDKQRDAQNRLLGNSLSTQASKVRPLDEITWLSCGDKYQFLRSQTHFHNHTLISGGMVKMSIACAFIFGAESVNFELETKLLLSGSRMSSNFMISASRYQEQRKIINFSFLAEMRLKDMCIRPRTWQRKYEHATEKRTSSVFVCIDFGIILV